MKVPFEIYSFVYKKETEKVEKRQDLRRGNRRLWQLRKVPVVPVVIDALGSATEDFESRTEKLRIPGDAETTRDCLVGNSKDPKESVRDVKERFPVNP